MKDAMLTSRLIAAQYIPYEIRMTFRNAEPSLCEEQDLWREVIARSVFDALGFTGLSENNKHLAAMLDARRWYRNITNENAMPVVFEMANLPIRPVRDTILKLKGLTVNPKKPKREIENVDELLRKRTGPWVCPKVRQRLKDHKDSQESENSENSKTK